MFHIETLLFSYVAMTLEGGQQINLYFIFPEEGAGAGETPRLKTCSLIRGCEKQCRVRLFALYTSAKCLEIPCYAVGQRAPSVLPLIETEPVTSIALASVS